MLSCWTEDSFQNSCWKIKLWSVWLEQLVLINWKLKKFWIVHASLTYFSTVHWLSLDWGRATRRKLIKYWSIYYEHSYHRHMSMTRTYRLENCLRIESHLLDNLRVFTRLTTGDLTCHLANSNCILGTLYRKKLPSNNTNCKNCPRSVIYNLVCWPSRKLLSSS